jgi:hypothetical protein
VVHGVLREEADDAVEVTLAEGGAELPDEVDRIGGHGWKAT